MSGGVKLTDRILVHVTCWCVARMTPTMRYHVGAYFHARHARIVGTLAGAAAHRAGREEGAR